MKNNLYNFATELELLNQVLTGMVWIQRALMDDPTDLMKQDLLYYVSQKLEEDMTKLNSEMYESSKQIEE